MRVLGGVAYFVVPRREQFSTSWYGETTVALLLTVYFDKKRGGLAVYAVVDGITHSLQLHPLPFI